MPELTSVLRLLSKEQLTVSGWYASAGEKLYRQKRVDQNPYEYIAYGGLAMNAISQALELMLPAGEVHFTYERHNWDQNGLTPVTILAVHPHPPHWLPNHRLFEPCTVITFDWNGGYIFAPLLTRRWAGEASIRYLFSSELGPETGRGYILSPRETFTIQNRLVFAPPVGLTRSTTQLPPNALPPGQSIVPGQMQASTSGTSTNIAQIPGPDGVLN